MSSEATVATNSPAANGAVDRYFDALAVPAFTIDDRAKVTQWNAAIQALTGKTDIRIGKLTFSLNITAIKDSKRGYIGNNIEWSDVTKARAEATRATSLFSMIEGASAYFMMCDRDLNITYLNPSLKEMLTSYQSELRALFPSFDINNIIGVCIDVFHKHPSHQRRLLEDVNNMPYAAEIKVGDLEFELTLTALKDAEGNHIGNAVEWSDLNSWAIYRNEVEKLIEESKAGNLAYRADLDKLDDIYRPMMEGIHEIIEAIVLPIQAAAGVLERVADRDLAARARVSRWLPKMCATWPFARPKRPRIRRR